MYITILEKFIALRYLRSRRAEGFISVSAWFSFLGIVLGVATLIVVMSVMNGFRTQLIDRILGINGHLIIYPNDGNYIKNYNNVIRDIVNIKDVVAVTPQVEGQALARSKDFISGVVVRGVRWTDLPSKKLLWKSLSKDAKNNYKKYKQILLGFRLAKKLNIKIGDKLTLFSANGLETPLGVFPQKQSFTVGGFFNIGMYEYDNNFIFLPWDNAQSFLLTNKNSQTLEIYLKDHTFSSKIKNIINDKISNKLIVLDWKNKNSSFINALNVEKNVMFLILSLIILVAAFNIISSMIMLVNTKRGDIAVLRAMGASKMVVIKIFLLIGSFVGILGTFFGTVLGICLSINIEQVRQFLSFIFNQNLFSPEVYFLTQLPSEIRIHEVVSVISISLVLSILASVYPSWKASRIAPAEALRYE